MLDNIATRIFNRPLAIQPEKAEAILRAIGPRLGVSQMTGIDGVAVNLNLEASLFDDEEVERYGYEVHNGIACIPIHGTLVQRGAWRGKHCGMTSYQGIRETFMEAMSDAAVKGIYLDVDSPGGEVSGLFDLVDDMARMVKRKPIHAHANELSASAAYAITTVADHISTTRTGITGSVGVIIIHSEFSRYLDKEGISVNIIRAGERKADANPYERLSKESRADLQGEVDYVRRIFVETVARNLELDQQVIWDTEAAVFTAPDAVRIGLVDAVMSTQQAAQHMLDAVG